MPCAAAKSGRRYELEADKPPSFERLRHIVAHENRARVVGIAKERLAIVSFLCGETDDVDHDGVMSRLADSPHFAVVAFAARAMLKRRT